MARIKQRDGEDFSDSNLERVIASLNSSEPITKKTACEMLNISYNTKRLNTIIQNYKERKENEKLQRKRMRSVAIQDHEKVEIISDYLAGASLSEISANTFRSINVIKRVLRNNNVPLRDSSNTYLNPAFVEESADDYKPDDLVYAARYGTAAYIVQEVEDRKDYKVYRIYLLGDYERNAIQASYDLADLRKIQKIGVNIKSMPQEEIKRLLYEAWLKSKKLDKKDR